MKATCTVTMMAELLGVNSVIVEIHRTSWFTYGSPRIHAELLAMGEKASKQLVEELMRQAGIQGVKKRKKRRPPRTIDQIWTREWA